MLLPPNPPNPTNPPNPGLQVLEVNFLLRKAATVSTPQMDVSFLLLLVLLAYRTKRTNPSTLYKKYKPYYTVQNVQTFPPEEGRWTLAWTALKTKLQTVRDAPARM